MAGVLITGSSHGLGLMAARLLVDDGHAVTLVAELVLSATRQRGQRVKYWPRTR
jgi:NAD(P)-dependent dehydrogenase (short-subunit alcohol dehydrogenase family)